MNNTRMQNYNQRCTSSNVSNTNASRTTCGTPMCDDYSETAAIQNMMVGMAYVPWQYFGAVYEPDKALNMGTIFPELYKPYVGCKGGRCNG